METQRYALASLNQLHTLGWCGWVTFILVVL